MAYRGGSFNETYDFNFGQRSTGFAHTPPTGFKALNTTNLPTPTIGATSTTQAGQYFNPVLYTGNASNDVTVTNTFASDLVWLKSRSNGDNHYLQDIVRGFGASKSLSSNTTGSEGFNGGSPATQNITTTSTSLRLQGQDFTQNTYTYVAWNWKANGAGVSNTDGSITSTVSANPTAGFSVVTYTGNSTNPSTVGHGLGVAPQFIIIKCRSNAYNWVVGSKAVDGFSSGKQLYLNTTSALVGTENFFSNTQPTSSVFTVKDNYEVNFSGYTYVAYCWTPIAGYSAFGSYTGNGSTDGPFIYTGFRPRWIMLKRSSAAGAPWSMFDTSRNTYNSTNLELDANTSSAESTSGNGMDILSNGFKLRDSAYLNSSSGDTFIYAAFAENPMKFSNAR